MRYKKTITNKLLDRKSSCPYQYNMLKMKKVGLYNAYLQMSSRRFATQSVSCMKGLHLYFS